MFTISKEHGNCQRNKLPKPHAPADSAMEAPIRVLSIAPSNQSRGTSSANGLHFRISVPFGNAEWITTLPNTSKKMQSGAGSLGPHYTAVVSWNHPPESWNHIIGPPAFPRGGRRGRAPVPADSSINVEPRSKTSFQKKAEFPFFSGVLPPVERRRQNLAHLGRNQLFTIYLTQGIPVGGGTCDLKNPRGILRIPMEFIGIP